MGVKLKRFLANNKSCSCSMSGVWRTVAYCQGAVMVFHSPKACAHITRTMDISSHYRTLANRRQEALKAVPLVSSNLLEKHGIFGGADRLSSCLDYVVKTYSPKCVMVANSCVVGVIGDDVESVLREAQAKYGIPFLTVPCYGFLDSEYIDGYYHGALQLINTFLRPQPQASGTVLLLGDNGGPWGDYAVEVKRLLKYFRVQVIGQFPGYVPIEEMAQLTQASLVIPMGARQTSHQMLYDLAEKLEKDFGMAYLDGGQPVGWDNTISWLRALGKALNQPEAAEAAIRQEEELHTRVVAEYAAYTRGKQVVVCLGRPLASHDPAQLLATLRLLQIDLKQIVLFDSYGPKEKEAMVARVAALTSVPILEAAAPESNEALAAADLILTTHEIKDCPTRQLFIPMLPIVGLKGERAMMQGMVRAFNRYGDKGGVLYV